MNVDRAQPLLNLARHDGLPPDQSGLVDASAVRTTVCAYAREIGCTESNAVGACSYALRTGANTLACIREGKNRAAVLRARQIAATTAN